MSFLLMFRSLVAVALVGAGFNASVCKANDLKLKRTLLIDAQSLAKNAQFFRVDQRFIVVNQNEDDRNPQTSITVYSNDGGILEIKRLEYAFVTAVLGDDQAVYILGSNGTVTRFGLTDTNRWTHSLSVPSNNYSSLKVGHNGIYVANLLASTLVSISQKDGNELWVTHFPDNEVIISDILLSQESIRILAYFASGTDKRQIFYEVDSKTGQLLTHSYYVVPNGEMTVPRSFIQGEDFLLGYVFNNNDALRIVKIDLHGKVIFDRPSSAICGTEIQGGLVIYQVTDRLYASCFNANTNPISTTLYEIDENAKIINSLGSVPTCVGSAYAFDHKVLFEGGYWTQDMGIEKFIFSDGKNLSPLETVLGDRAQYPVQLFNMRDDKNGSELASLSYDNLEFGRQFIRIYGAL